MEGVDFRVAPVDEFLGLVAPLHHQHVHLNPTGQAASVPEDQSRQTKLQTYKVLTREEALLDAQQLHVADVDLLHGEAAAGCSWMEACELESSWRSEEEKTGRKPLMLSLTFEKLCSFRRWLRFVSGGSSQPFL